MGWTDSHGRPELRMHPDLKRGVASYRRETPDDQNAPGNAAPARTDDSTSPPAKPIAE